MESKTKILGQYYSGELIPGIFHGLIQPSSGMDVIDPMAGIGDMLSPFLEKCNCTAVEIDPEAYISLKKKIPNSFCNNSFSQSSFDRYNPQGYDLVITNPPYVRRELQQKADILPNFLSIDTVKRNLRNFAEHSLIYDESAIQLIVSLIDSVSGLSDLAVYSWILCMLLTKPAGNMSMVVPISWLSREYAKPVMSLFGKLFTIRYIIRDNSSHFFSGKALVRTCLISATRKSCDIENNKIKVVDIFNEYFLKEPSSQQICKDIASNVVNDTFSVNSYPQDVILQKFRESVSLLDETSFLNKYVGDHSELQSAAQYGVTINQGFRSGANNFFYFIKKGSDVINLNGDRISYKLIRDFLLPAIQIQEDISDAYSVSKTNKYVLYITNACTKKDKAYAVNKQLLPDVLSNYISKYETTPVNGKLVPTMSAVRSNVKKDIQQKDSRFWYMLPEMKARHCPVFFFPRVNGGKIVTYFNAGHNIIDANFLTVSLSEDSVLSLNAVFALLNSTWTSILLEERGTVLGGGALKLDAAQLRTLPFPKLSSNALLNLDLLGGQLIHASISRSKSIITSIDSTIIQGLGYSLDIKKTCKQLETILNEIIRKRNG